MWEGSARGVARFPALRYSLRRTVARRQPDLEKSSRGSPMSSTQRSRPSSADLPEPIREEIWGAERLEQHALQLAGTQRVRVRRRGDPRLTPRVRENGRVLLESYRTIAAAIREERAITPAAEWL